MTKILDPSEVAVQLEAAVPQSVDAIVKQFLILNSTHFIPAVRFLRDAHKLDLGFLANLTAIDWETHFDLVYQLQSLDSNHMLHCKIIVADHDRPRAQSLFPLYTGALLQERELFDLMGIYFIDHPDLRRMFLWDGFPGHPLRKDFLGMPGGLHAGLPSFPNEPGSNVWPVPGSTPYSLLGESNKGTET